MNLDKWGIVPNFKPKYAELSLRKYTKKNAKMSVIPKNGKSIPLTRKSDKPFDFKKKKFTHTIIGNYSIAKNRKRNVLLTNGFQVIIEKV